MLDFDLRTERELAGLSKKDLAEMTGLNLTSIYNIENGAKEPRIRTVRLLKRTLGLELEFNTHNNTRIELDCGNYFEIDPEYFEDFYKYKWSKTKGKNTYYAATYVREKTIMAHRVIMPNPDFMVDHINGDGLDNKEINLRYATGSQNNMNSIKRENCSSIYKGVSLFKRDNIWTAQIKVYGKNIHLGRFDIEIEAAHAYDKAAKEYFGEYALLNFDFERDP